MLLIGLVHIPKFGYLWLLFWVPLWCFVRSIFNIKITQPKGVSNQAKLYYVSQCLCLILTDTVYLPASVINSYMIGLEALTPIILFYQLQFEM